MRNILITIGTVTFLAIGAYALFWLLPQQIMKIAYKTPEEVAAKIALKQAVFEQEQAAIEARHRRYLEARASMSPQEKAARVTSDAVTGAAMIGAGTYIFGKLLDSY